MRRESAKKPRNKKREGIVSEKELSKHWMGVFIVIFYVFQKRFGWQMWPKRIDLYRVHILLQDRKKCLTSNNSMKHVQLLSHYS